MIRMSSTDKVVHAKEAKNTESPNMDSSQWEDMPKPASPLTVSWEDITGKAEEMGVTLTREQVISIFQKMESHFGDSVMDLYWEQIADNIRGD